MILNGHNRCKTGEVFQRIFRYCSVQANCVNAKRYATSISRHIWTFDDALIEQFEIYYKSFESAKICYHLFLCPKLIDEWEMGNVDYVRRQLNNQKAELMPWESIGRLASAGIVLGSHGVDHASFSKMSADEAAEQFELSREMIKSRTGCEVYSFAFPFGRVSPSSIDASLFARRWYREVYLSDNSLRIGEISDGVFNRRHAEFGECAARGILVGMLNILFDIKIQRT